MIMILMIDDMMMSFFCLVPLGSCLLHTVILCFRSELDRFSVKREGNENKKKKKNSRKFSCSLSFLWVSTAFMSCWVLFVLQVKI